MGLLVPYNAPNGTSYMHIKGPFPGPELCGICPSSRMTVSQLYLSMTFYINIASVESNVHKLHMFVARVNASYMVLFLYTE